MALTSTKSIVSGISLLTRQTPKTSTYRFPATSLKEATVTAAVAQKGSNEQLFRNRVDFTRSDPLSSILLRRQSASALVVPRSRHMSSKPFDIKGKAALVTGGAAGIGLCCVKELLKYCAKGVTIADLSCEAGEEAAEQINCELGSNRASFIRTDVTQADQLQAAFCSAVKTWKALDIVVNNAGIINDRQWELEIAINSTHVVRSSLLALQIMGKNNGGNGGVVVNVASILGLQALAGSPVYVGTKHFVVGLTRSLGTCFFYDKAGIRFLTLCPGVTDTALVAQAGKDTLEGFPGMPEELVNGLGSLPKQTPEKVAEGLITMIKKGENGSVWVSEGEEPIYEVVIPDRQSLRK